MKKVNKLKQIYLLAVTALQPNGVKHSVNNLYHDGKRSLNCTPEQGERWGSDCHGGLTESRSREWHTRHGCRLSPTFFSFFFIHGAHSKSKSCHGLCAMVTDQEEEDWKNYWFGQEGWHDNAKFQRLVSCNAIRSVICWCDRNCATKIRKRIAATLEKKKKTGCSIKL